MPNYGEYNAKLTKAVNRLAKSSSENIYFDGSHVQERMDEREIDLIDALTCLCRGKAYGPEPVKNSLRANVIHRGIHVRVVIAGLDDVGGDWDQLLSVTVVSVIEEK